MKVFIDIGHPAHVHYFRNLIKIMQTHGHDFFISARDKEVSEVLLNSYGIPFYSRGKGSSNLAGKFFYLFKAVVVLYLKIIKYKPDVLISFASPYAAIVSKLTGRPHISFTDTDKAKLAIVSFAPFTKHILTPASFKKTFGEKHIRFNGFMELCYLHPTRYLERGDVYDEMNLMDGEPYAIFRFVSWGANHDIGENGFNEESKIAIVKEVSKKMKVFISAEGDLPTELKSFRIKLPPDRMHSVLKNAIIFIGEGATMASECAMLGTPAIYVNSLTAGTIEEQEAYGLLFSFRNSDGVLEKAMEMLNNPNLEKEFILKRSKMLSEKIDVTGFMVWFVENYPASVKIIQENPDYQYKFR